ncbi:JAB domain-containing protein [Bacillus sp. FSL K6-6540]|uniref:JAB domain-containing protein n=1 Tax=Bacillus sp. FSL K6-6540 TaxID=2921512 RepID=UPI0030FA045E
MKKISLQRVKLVKYGHVLYDNLFIRNTDDAERICRIYLQHEYQGFPDREVFVVVWLNVKNMIVGLETVSVGTLNATIVTPREVFKSGILHNAASFICFHNHPSGITTPSEHDVRITKRLAEIGELLDIILLDHLILADDAYLSLKKEGFF